MAIILLLFVAIVATVTYVSTFSDRAMPLSSYFQRRSQAFSIVATSAFCAAALLLICSFLFYNGLPQVKLSATLWNAVAVFGFLVAMLYMADKAIGLSTPEREPRIAIRDLRLSSIKIAAAAGLALFAIGVTQQLRDRPDG